MSFSEVVFEGQKPMGSRRTLRTLKLQQQRNPNLFVRTSPVQQDLDTSVVCGWLKQKVQFPTEM